jgi:ribA/ribD-fused uncharacterized protein
MSVTARGCCFFYSHTRSEHACFSQFYLCHFQDEAGAEYTCAEQYMMAGKARTFGDQDTLAEIMEAADPATIKALGRRVRGFDQTRWETVRQVIVEHGNYLKFSQNKRLRKALLETGDKTLVEAARNDSIWGIGISVKDAAAGAKWRGLNLLGRALMAARAALMEGQRVPPPPFPDLDASEPAATEQIKPASEADAHGEVGRS